MSNPINCSIVKFNYENVQFNTFIEICPPNWNYNNENGFCYSLLMNATSFASAKRQCDKFNYFESQLFYQSWFSKKERDFLGEILNNTQIWVDFGILLSLILNKKDF